MIQLFQFPKAKNIPSESPFCMKLESYFRAVELPYKNQFIMDPRQSPTGKIPYILENDKLFSDSGIIINYYESIIEKPMQSDLSQLQCSQSLAYIRLLEEHLYWAIVYSRWIDPDGEKIWKQSIQKGLNIPKLAFKLMFPAVKKKIQKQLYGHGIGRHKHQQIYLFADNDITALANFLGKNTYFFGEKATLLDHCTYSHIASLIHSPESCPLKQSVLKHENLIKHYQRMMHNFFPEFLNN